MAFVIFIFGALLVWFGGWSMLQYLNRETESYIYLYGGLVLACFGIAMAVGTLSG